jgi:hypothetical protein
MLSVDFIANAVAALVLAGMMFLPFVNILVGGVVGGCLAGFAGIFGGAAFAVLLTAVEVWLLRVTVITSKPAVEPVGQADGRPLQLAGGWLSASPLPAEQVPGAVAGIRGESA